MILVGRKKEKEELLELFEKDSAELVAVYGRRRIGKTYLINQTFEDKFTFKHAGISPLELEDNKSALDQQLEHFYNSLKLYGMKENKKPKTWLEAFYMLERLLLDKANGQKQVVFIDELPWLDTPKSKFISAFEAFWNSFANAKNIIVIICGSANSWIFNEVINNYGGLYGRVTKEIKIIPFTLAECEEFLKYKNVKMSRYEIVKSYMAVGGVPYYLNYFDSKYTTYENIDSLFFSKYAPLKLEFNRLFNSTFKRAEDAEKIVTALSLKNIGLTRSQIIEKTGIKDGENLTKTLNALLISDYIIKYVPLTDNKEKYYKLIDPFCIFYLKFVKNSNSLNEELFANKVSSQSIISYNGIAFENVCFNHIMQIKDALRIGGLETKEFTFLYKAENEEGAQIDLIIDRKDNIVNACEIKFYSDLYANDKDKHLNLVRKNNALSKFIKKRQIIRNTLITTYGLANNEYKNDYVNVITLDDLFKY